MMDFSALQIGFNQASLALADRQRTYHLFVPFDLDANERLPLIFALHGSGSCGQEMAEFCRIHELASQHRFFVVYPDGSGRIPTALTWNSGNCCGYAHRHQVDDVLFFRTLISTLTKSLPVAENQIFATGMSNGAMMCYRLANELAQQISAIATVAGTMDFPTCEPGRPVPILHIHGTDDLFVKYEGGPGPMSISRGDFTSVNHTINQWKTANRCHTTSIVKTLPRLVEDDTTVELTVFEKQQENSAEFRLYTVHQGGHTWPGQKNKYPKLGKVSFNLDANQVIVEFFQRHLA